MVRVTQTTAFERYVLPEVDVLLRVGRALTRNDADAEDLVQETLIRAHRNIERFDGRHPRAWLLTILRNANINRTRRRRPELLRDPDRTFAESTEGASDDSADGFIELGFHHALERALDSLDEPFRQVVELVDIQGLSYADAAAALGVPPGTVMSRLHRARNRLRLRLEHTALAPRSER
jgi:RNA polymerase sigma-70 factor (ECF subfamily)